MSNPDNRLIPVEYVGKIDVVTAEFNGKRYVFSKRNPLSRIPWAVLRNIMTSQAHFAADIVPYVPAYGEAAKEQLEKEQSKPSAKSKRHEVRQ